VNTDLPSAGTIIQAIALAGGKLPGHEYYLTRQNMVDLCRRWLAAQKTSTGGEPMKLTTKESLALQAMVKRAGFAAVLDDLQVLAFEAHAEHETEASADDWEELANGLFHLRDEASALEGER
jgi:hypothetical protein